MVNLLYVEEKKSSTPKHDLKRIGSNIRYRYSSFGTSLLVPIYYNFVFMGYCCLCIGTQFGWLFNVYRYVTD